MPIVGSCVAFQNVIVSEDRISTTIRPAVMKMLERLPRHDTMASFQYENLAYHFMIENEIVYLCVSDKVYQSRTVFGFLNEAKGKFKELFGGAGTRYPSPTELTPKNCARFNSQLITLTKMFNDNPQADKLGRIQSEIDAVKQVMLENLDDLLNRGERIDTLCDKTEMLKEEAQGFHNNARTLKKKMWWRNVKIMIAAFLLICLLALIISFIACGIDFKKCKSSESSASSSTPSPTPSP
mmetsp:Transcript_74859/g.86904  ORF Transcript_74859/g.86904 Transcript_74859/m.86904 type:complete len:239 (-) Transcript_74859:36-752(-)